MVNIPVIASPEQSGCFAGSGTKHQALVTDLLNEFREGTVDLTSDLMTVERVCEAAEKAKIELTSAQQTEINLPFITPDASAPKHINLSTGLWFSL
jgi:molecular chaperone DnaK (HSP70)